METNFKKLWIGSNDSGGYDYEVEMLSNGFRFQFTIDCTADVHNEVNWIECPNGAHYMDSEVKVNIQVQPGDLTKYECYNSRTFEDINYSLFMHEISTICKMFECDLEDYLVEKFIEEDLGRSY